MNFILKTDRITTQDLNRVGRLLGEMSETPGVVLNMDTRALSFSPDITQEAREKAASLFAEVCRIPGVVLEMSAGTPIDLRS